jgi:hypothetical protein
MADFGQIPSTAKVQPQPFKAAISQDAIDEMKTLIKYGKIATPSYENQQADGRYGITRDWLIEAKDYWLNKYDW